MAVKLADYLLMLAEAIGDRQGPHLAYLLRPTSSHAKDLIKEFRNPTVRLRTTLTISYVDEFVSRKRVYQATKDILKALGTR